MLIKDPELDRLKKISTSARLGAQKSKREVLVMESKILGRKKATRKNRPGAGPPILYDDIEKELADLIMEGRRCSFLDSKGSEEGSLSALTGSEYYWWGSYSAIESFKRRIRTVDPGTHTVFEAPYVWLRRFIVRRGIVIWSSSRLKRFQGMTHEEIENRICGTFSDFYKFTDSIKNRYSKLILAFVDETSLPLEPPPGKLLGGKILKGPRPAKGTYRLVTYMPTITSDPELNMHPYFIGSNSFPKWERELLSEHYRTGRLDYTPGVGNLGFSFDGSITCRAYWSGSSNGTTHLDGKIWQHYLGEFRRQIRAQLPSDVGVVLIHDGARAHTDNPEYDELSLCRNLHLFKLRANMTSFICLHDQLFFSYLKKRASDKWVLQASNLVSNEVKKLLLREYRTFDIGNFESMGFSLGGPVPFDYLHSRIQTEVCKDKYTLRMDQVSRGVIPPSSRAQVVEPRAVAVAVSTTAELDPNLDWMRDGEGVPKNAGGRRDRVENVLNTSVTEHFFLAGSRYALDREFETGLVELSDSDDEII